METKWHYDDAPEEAGYYFVSCFDSGTYQTGIMYYNKRKNSWTKVRGGYFVDGSLIYAWAEIEDPKHAPFV